MSTISVELHCHDALTYSFGASLRACASSVSSQVWFCSNNSAFCHWHMGKLQAPEHICIAQAAPPAICCVLPSNQSKSLQELEDPVCHEIIRLVCRAVLIIRCPERAFLNIQQLPMRSGFHISIANMCTDTAAVSSRSPAPQADPSLPHFEQLSVQSGSQMSAAMVCTGSEAV